MRKQKKTNVVLKNCGDILLREGALGKDDEKAGLANGTVANHNKLHVSHRGNEKKKKKKRGGGVWRKTKKKHKKVSQKHKKTENGF